ncbi:uncharacterized protein LOC119831676 isoform X2 [Zerene cesonia]|uniref:uncharacterized protein LOC119831676 isoform X2 n=1 Tax=Zerene cesonia TaxID=33412 RepID=UPI0018E5759B|nr:uncharacterized protein LOC119831676 isoform X2 [Zerene cesonia]
MESFEDSNCPSMSDSFSLYERYMRSFNVREHFDDRHSEQSVSSSSRDYDSSNSGGNIDLSVAVPANLDKHGVQLIEPVSDSLNPIYENVEKDVNSDSLIEKSSSVYLITSSVGSSSEQCMTDKSDLCEVRVFSEESKSGGEKPVFITSMMENSNNAVDSVPMFRDVVHENVFKLPISELSFNGTIKHVQKLKPIVDPLTALSTANVLNVDDNSESKVDSEIQTSEKNIQAFHVDERSASDSRNDKTESSGDSQYQDKIDKDSTETMESSKWNLEQSYSSLEASFDSGVRSPDMFSDGDDTENDPEPEPIWTFLKDVEICEKKKVRRIQETLQGILPPPSVTTLKTDVTQMLKKYYCFLPAFNGEQTLNIEENSMTPTKKVSFIQIPDICQSIQETADNVSNPNLELEKISSNSSRTTTKCEDGNSSMNDKSIELKMGSEAEAKENAWPDILKCRYHDVYYNLTSYTEKYEMLMQRYAERFVGAETDTSVNIYSGGLQSPSSASKRKALRLKMAQAKSPGRRLSHLARRRQAFCSAATIGEKAQSSTSKMVLIDKKKLINSAERKSPRTKRTPGKKTPSRKTPGKKTPAKTPKTGGSSKKKAMRRLVMDDNLSKTQPNRETLKRALFISPENRKAMPSASSMSVPNQAIKSRRALFGSPVRMAETKSMDGTQSDHFLKRKRDPFDDDVEGNRSKIAKSLSFGGDIGSAKAVAFNRRASEMLSTRNSAELNETHKKKLLWAVSEALRLHGWRMSSPGFKEKASSLARLTRKLLTLPPHAAKLAAPKLSTSDTLFKLARQYVFAIIQGRTVEECFQDEQIKLANETNKISGYISATAYQQLKSKPHTLTSQIKENCTDKNVVQEPKSASKNILQDKLVNIDSNSSGTSMFDKVQFRSNSMPSFEEAAKMRARRQISFDNVEFPKR